MHDSWSDGIAKKDTIITNKKTNVQYKVLMIEPFNIGLIKKETQICTVHGYYPRITPIQIKPMVQLDRISLSAISLKSDDELLDLLHVMDYKSMVSETIFVPLSWATDFDPISSKVYYFSNYKEEILVHVAIIDDYYYCNGLGIFIPMCMQYLLTSEMCISISSKPIGKTKPYKPYMISSASNELDTRNKMNQKLDQHSEPLSFDLYKNVPEFMNLKKFLEAAKNSINLNITWSFSIVGENSTEAIGFVHDMKTQGFGLIRVSL